MAKVIAKFDTVPVNSELDPAGGYTLKLKDRPVYDESQVFEEVVKEKTLPFDKDMLEFAFLSVLKTMALKVSRDCNPRKVGNYLKFTPTLRGKVKGMYSAYNPQTCTSAITVSSLSGLDKAVDTNYVSFVNSREGVAVTILKICTLGEQDTEGVSTITKGKGVICVGTNLQYLPGDKVEIHWTNAEGADASVEVVPTESDIAHMTFAWPEALDDLPDGTELLWKFSTRGGLADGDPQENEKAVTLVEGVPEPSVTKVATEGQDGIVKGAAFEATGSNLGFNFANDHVSVKWTVGGVTNQAALVPVSATAEKISFSSCVLFDDIPDGTELTFEFELGGKRTAKGALLVPAPTVRIDKVIDQEGEEDNIACYNGEVHVKGENLMLLPGDTVKVRGTHYETREEIEHVFENAVYNAETGEIDITVGDADTEDLVSRFDTDAAELVVMSCGGVSGSAPQVTTRSITLKGV